jgi:hypothetical protein
MAYYAITDVNAGYIQFVGEADSPAAAIAAFDVQVGIDPHGLGLEKAAEEFVVTEISASTYALLRDCDGTDPDALALLSAYKDNRWLCGAAAHPLRCENETQLKQVNSLLCRSLHW